MEPAKKLKKVILAKQHRMKDEVEKREIKKKLAEKDNRIAELERLVEELRSGSSNNDTYYSLDGCDY